MHNTVNKKEILSKILPVIENTAATLGLIPVEVAFTKESSRWFLRIFIYSHDHPISHKDCESMTQGLNDYLDELIPVHYYLEISSPGIDRRLKSPKEYNIFKGKEVEIKLKHPLEGSDIKNFIAKIKEYYPDLGLKVETIDDSQEITIKENEIHSIKLHISDKFIKEIEND